MNSFVRLLICMGMILLCAAKSPAADQNPEDLSQAAFQKINAYRVKNHLPPLIWNDEMASVARKQSQLMGIKKVSFGHSGASKRFEELRKSMPNLMAYGENIAYNYDRPDLAGTVVNNWIKSSSHHENIVDDFTHTGVGAFRNKDGYTYLTQVFGKIVEPSPEKLEKSSNVRKIIFNSPIKPR